MKKKCKRCNSARPLKQFKKASWNKDGHSGICRFCDVDRAKRYTNKMKEGIIKAF